VQPLFISDRLWRIFYNFIIMFHGFSKILYLFFTGLPSFSYPSSADFLAVLYGF
jgi:hypothetical protein